MVFGQSRGQDGARRTCRRRRRPRAGCSRTGSGSYKSQAHEPVKKTRHFRSFCYFQLQASINYGADFCTPSVFKTSKTKASQVVYFLPKYKSRRSLYIFGWSVCHKFPKGREATLPCSYRNNCSIRLFFDIFADNLQLSQRLADFGNLRKCSVFFLCSNPLSRSLFFKLQSVFDNLSYLSYLLFSHTLIHT